MSQIKIYQTTARLNVQANALTIAARAGMGVDSGLPEFRGNEGPRAAYPALSNVGIELCVIANPISLKNYPKITAQLVQALAIELHTTKGGSTCVSLVLRQEELNGRPKVCTDADADADAGGDGDQTELIPLDAQ